MNEKQDVSSAKYLFAGIIHLGDRFFFTSSIVYAAFAIHSYVSHGMFSPYLLAGTIVCFLLWVTFISIQNSWFSKGIGRELERLTKLEETVYVS